MLIVVENMQKKNFRREKETAKNW